MVAFQEKKLEDSSIGEILRTARDERGETLEDVERLTHVGKKYIAALELGELKKLPEPVYAKKFVMALAKHYGLEPQAAAESLMKELTVVTGVSLNRHPTSFIEGRSLVVTPALLKTGIIATVFLAIVGYFFFSVHNILKPPSVTLYSPRDQQVFATGRVVLQGITEPEVDLAVNGEPVQIETDGSFQDVLNLPPGVSQLRLTAKKRHSNTNEMSVKVVVNEPVEAASATDTQAL